MPEQCSGMPEDEPQAQSTRVANAVRSIVKASHLPAARHDGRCLFVEVDGRYCVRATPGGKTGLERGC